MSLSQIPGRSASEAGDERYRGDAALADEFQRRGRLVAIEATINNTETIIAHGQTTVPTIVSMIPVATWFATLTMTRRPDRTSLYLRASSGSATYQITLLVRDR